VSLSKEKKLGAKGIVMATLGMEKSFLREKKKKARTNITTVDNSKLAPKKARRGF